MKIPKPLKDALIGAAITNATEIGGAVGAYTTYSDMPYAWDLALQQLTTDSVKDTLVGVAPPLFGWLWRTAKGKLKRGGNQHYRSNGNRKNRKRR